MRDAGEIGMSPNQTAVFIVDDDLAVRDMMKALLRSVGFDAQAFGSADEFLAARLPDLPRCLVLDIRLPGMSGLDLQRHLLERNAAIPIVFVTGYGDVPMCARALKAGAVDFLQKPFREQELLDAVRVAIQRDSIERQNRAEAAELQQRYDSLTAREREVLVLVVQGLLNKQIGDVLKIAEPTVKLHRGHIMHKMHAESLASLILMFEKLRSSPHSKRSMTAT